MTPEKWNVYLPKIAGDSPDDVCRNESDLALQREFIATFARFLPRGRVLAPGAVTDAVLLAEAGYEVHALVLGEENLRWFGSQEHNCSSSYELLCPGRVHARERDAHDLDYPADYFDGYFSCQVHEHFISPYVHIGEVRYCMHDGGIVFVDAAGTINPAMRQVWHVGLSPERELAFQWAYWGFKERWRGSSGDERPQFIFEKLPLGHPDFANSDYVDEVMRKRAAL